MFEREFNFQLGGDYLYQIDIPSLGAFCFEHIVFDFNGTLATRGILEERIVEKLELLAMKLQVHVLTADTFGTVRSALSNTNVLVAVVSEENGTEAKCNYIQELDASCTIAVGNGSVDTKMLRTAQLGIAVIGHEGLSVKAMKDSDLIFTSIDDVFDTLLNPMSLIATLRE